MMAFLPWSEFLHYFNLQSRPVGWSGSGGVLFQGSGTPKGRGSGADSGGQGAKPPEALKFTSLT